MNCYVHSESVAVATCANCGRYICSQCMTKVGEITFCRNCAAGRNITDSSLKSNTLAIISLILGILGIPLTFCYGIGILFSIGALITGIIAKVQIKESGGTESGNGMALAGIILGSIIGVLLICSVVVIVILALMGPAIGTIFSNVVQAI